MVIENVAINGKLVCLLS